MDFFDLKDIESYYIRNRKLRQAFDWIKNQDFENIRNGNYIIDGDNCFALISEYNTKKKANVLFEYHKKYIDVQMLLKGKEIINVTDLDNIKTVVDYSNEKDIAFGEKLGGFKELIMEETKVAIFFPTDAHQPCLQFSNHSEKVRKLVIKIKN